MLTLPDVEIEQWRRFHLEGDRQPVGPEGETFRRWERVRELAERGPSWARRQLVSASVVHERMHRVAPILDRARDVLSTAIDELTRRGCVVVIANEEGIILASWGREGLADARHRAEFQVGARWDEASRGTNAIGTALAEQRPISVLGRSHYLETAHGLACYAALIESPYDDTVLVLDVTGPAAAADPILGVLTESLATTLAAALQADTRLRRQAPTGALERTLQADHDRFLAEASLQLGTSLDLGDTLEVISQVVLDSIADWCMLDLVDGDARFSRAFARTRFTSKQAIADALATEQLEVGRPYLQFLAMEQRRPIVASVVTESLCDAIARSGPHRELIRQMSMTSIMAVPLFVGQKVLGAMLFASSSLHYGAHHAALAMELARRFSLAISNAQLHRAAQDAASSRAEVLAIVAHDLRGPLNAIDLSSALLQQHAGDGVSDRAVRSIVGSTRRMNRLIEDLFDASRNEADRLSLVATAIDTTSLLDEAQDIALALRQRTVREGEDVPAIRGDRERLLQVFTNLLGNAAKFTPHASAVVIGARRDGKHVRFWVRDHGPGLTPDAATHVFERFWKGDSADRRGTGLGLYISKRIVEDHGGTIGVHSTSGAGATFWFTVPVSSP